MPRSPLLATAVAALAGAAVIAGCAAVAPPLPLQGTAWRLVGTEPGARAAQLLLQDGGRVTGSDGCNRLMGAYDVAGTSLRFGKLAGTRMACPQLGGRDAAFDAALGRVTQWRIDGRRLTLSADGAVVLEFEAEAP